MNSVKLVGNVGSDIDVKNFDASKKASFSLATSDSYFNKNKEEVKETAWHNIIAWGPIAQRCETLLAKGKLVSIEGKISYRQYQNKENQTVRVTEIVALKVDEVVKNQDVKA